MSVHLHLLDTESALRVVHLEFFDCFNYGFDVLIFGHWGRGELDMMTDRDEERNTIEKRDVGG